MPRPRKFQSSSVRLPATCRLRTAYSAPFSPLLSSPLAVSLPGLLVGPAKWRSVPAIARTHPAEPKKSKHPCFSFVSLVRVEMRLIGNHHLHIANQLACTRVRIELHRIPGDVEICPPDGSSFFRAQNSRFKIEHRFAHLDGEIGPLLRRISRYS